MEPLGVVVAAGPTVTGRLLKSDRPLSFWGGLDPTTGLVVDRHHPLVGACVTGRILALPAGRGSSTASAVWLEAVRRGTAPLALIMSRLDPIWVLGAVVAEELYGDHRLMVVVPDDVFRRLDGSQVITLTETGAIMPACDGAG